MDVGLVSFVVAAVAADPHFALNDAQRSWVLSIGFLGMAVGAMLGGVLADRFGRTTVFTATLVVFGLASCAMALSWSLAMLLAARFVIGLGLGAELPVASTLVSEFAPATHRGRMSVMLEAFRAVGWTLAAAIGYFVIPSTGDWGWRWALLIGALPLAYAIVARLHIPESVRFLESRGRDEEAERSVRHFERASGVEAPVASPYRHVAVRPRTRVRALFSARYRRRTVVIWLTWFFVNFSYYGAFTWMPSLLAHQFGSLTRSFGYTLLISLAQLPGYALAAWLVEVWGATVDAMHLPCRVRGHGHAVRRLRFARIGHRLRHAALLGEHGRMGCAVRRDARDLSHRHAGHRIGLGRRGRQTGGHRGPVARAVVPCGIGR